MESENQIFTLTEGVEVKIDYIRKIGPGIDGYRVILKIYSTQPKEAAGLIKAYEVWVSQEYLEDNEYKYTDQGAAKFAKEIIQKRFQESGNTVPRENGLKATSEHGVELGNPQFISAAFTRLNVIVTKDQAVWLKEKSIKLNSNVSAVIRNILDETKHK